MILTLIYAFFIYPIEYFIETVYSISINLIPNYGLAICSVSIAVQLLTLPIYKRADAIQDTERLKQKKMEGWIRHIRSTFKGDERIMMLQEYYRVEHYHPLYSLRSSLSILLQIPFFIAAYHYLSNLSELNGNSFWILSDLGSPDALLRAGGISINALPVIMTLINLLSGYIYTRGFALKEKLQLYITALIFLVLLYNSPSGLVFYWTLNNLFSLFKNIFMKVFKNPRKIIDTASLAFGVLFVLYCLYRHKFDGASYRLVIYTVFICCCLPILESHFPLDKIIKKSEPGEAVCRNRLFMACAVAMTLILGLWIPSGIVSVSPEEFVIQGHYVDPNFFVLHSTTVAAGMFLLWLMIIYRFMNDRIQILFSYLLWMLVCITLADYFFFSKGLGNMSATMIYDYAPGYTAGQKMINMACLAVISALAVILLKHRACPVTNICMILSVVILIMGMVNVVKTELRLSDMSYLKNDDYYNENKPELEFSKTDKNVIVLMLDRAISGYVPYILKEKPELKEKLSGFTYYPNTLSTGGGTKAGAPGLFGGYEYSAYELERRKDEEDVEKHDEAMRVLPTIFAHNGYDCKVIDIPFPGYGTKSVAELYEDIDNVKGYNMSGYAKTPEQSALESSYFNDTCMHNMIRHSVFIASPLILRHGIYHNATYLGREMEIDYNIYLWALQQYKDITTASSDQGSSFFMLCNDSTHFEAGLQLPDYTEEAHPDNSPYWDEWLENFTEDGVEKVHMEEGLQTFHYMTEMAALLEVGRWFDRLRELGVYDNTRIIITADHGFALGQFDDMILEDGFDTETLNPILLYKDFDSEGFSVSDDFMVNADAPILAMDKTVSDEINPYTGKDMKKAQEKAKEEGVIVTNLNMTAAYTMKNSSWYRVVDNIFDHSDWEKLDIEW